MVCSLYSTTIMNNEERRDAEDYRSMLKWRKQQELIKEQKKHDDALKFGSETIYPSLGKVVVKDVKPLSQSLQFKSALIKKPNSSIKQVAQSQIYTNTIKSQTHTKIKTQEYVGHDLEESDDEFNSNLAEIQYLNKW